MKFSLSGSIAAFIRNETKKSLTQAGFDGVVNSCEVVSFDGEVACISISGKLTNVRAEAPTKEGLEVAAREKLEELAKVNFGVQILPFVFSVDPSLSRAGSFSYSTGDGDCAKGRFQEIHFSKEAELHSLATFSSKDLQKAKAFLEKMQNLGLIWRGPDEILTDSSVLYTKEDVKKAKDYLAQLDKVGTE